MKFKTLLFVLFLINFKSFGQIRDSVYNSSIYTVQLTMASSQLSLPVYNLNSGDRLLLGFDDMDADVKSYYYTYQLCDYNWNPVNLNQFDYIKGFNQNRISNYRFSSLALTRYTHYQVILPERNSVPTKSGNYILKVFLDGDTNKLVFTKRMLVADQKASVAAQVVQPFTPSLYSTHQRVKFSVVLKDLNSFSAAQQVKVVILQNNRWDNMEKDIVPTFVRGNSLEYNSENVGVFPGGKEWRWVDIRSLRLQSDRIDSGKYEKNKTELFMKTDVDRNTHRYFYFADFSGGYNIETYESINPQWQGDYATIYFSLEGQAGLPYTNKDVYLAGKFTDFSLSEKWKMKYNNLTGKYENNAFMKQGYYNYEYITVDKSTGAKGDLEGNYWETQNQYTILVYYKSFTDRNDQLIGISQINSRTDKPGFSF